eukprot:scaffold53647_cov43-Phaeocystis_antarctica.AAC.1
MPAMLSLEKNFTSGSSSAAFSRSLVSSFSRQSSPTRFPTFLQHLTASMRRLGTLSSHISRMCGQSLAWLGGLGAELGLQLVLVKERGEDGGALEQHGTELEALLRLALLEHG